MDFRNLNQASLKDNYPLPAMDHILEMVSSSEMMSMLGGLSGYNQISVSKKDQRKTNFITPWDTFSYNRMSFGLINARETFQRAMEFSFGHLKDKIIVMYLDYLTIFLKRRKHHLRDLRQVLQRCREHGVSLNLKKSVFEVTEGKLLGHIISKEGVKVDPERVKEIQQLSLPSNRNAVSFLFG